MTTETLVDMRVQSTRSAIGRLLDAGARLRGAGKWNAHLFTALLALASRRSRARLASRCSSASSSRQMPRSSVLFARTRAKLQSSGAVSASPSSRSGVSWLERPTFARSIPVYRSASGGFMLAGTGVGAVRSLRLSVGLDRGLGRRFSCRRLSANLLPRGPGDVRFVDQSAFEGASGVGEDAGGRCGVGGRRGDRRAEELGYVEVDDDRTVPRIARAAAFDVDLKRAGFAS